MSDVILEAEELAKRYGQRMAVDGPSFGVRRGQWGLFVSPARRASLTQNQGCLSQNPCCGRTSPRR
ncbi:MAG: hypothetical protein NTW86_19195 [Candidatus Sumerlaeota bacterium]|nr:hypothetical protein [Candidatus Sumerlaeota bacterium]